MNARDDQTPVTQVLGDERPARPVRAPAPPDESTYTPAELVESAARMDDLEPRSSAEEMAGALRQSDLHRSQGVTRQQALDAIRRYRTEEV